MKNNSVEFLLTFLREHDIATPEVDKIICTEVLACTKCNMFRNLCCGRPVPSFTQEQFDMLQKDYPEYFI